MKGKARIRGNGMKKLRDYPAVPGTPPPPPPDRGPDVRVACLEKELDRERVYLSVLNKENKEIEGIIQDLEKEVHYVRGHFPNRIEGDGRIHADNEFWLRYEAQMEANRRLERERRHLESEIKQMEDQGMINLDSLTQSELILYVKQLERTKTDLLSDLRAKEWSLDKQAKDYHHLSETKRRLEAEIKHYDSERALFRHYKRISCPSASANASLQSSQKNSARLRHRKLCSISHENLRDASEASAAFRSLDDSRLGMESPVPGLQRQMRKSRENCKKPVECKAGTVPLPGLGQTKAPAPKTVRSKSEHDKSRGREIQRPVNEAPEKPGWNRTARTESGIGSPSDYPDEYEDDFEESDTEEVKPEKEVRKTRSATRKEVKKPRIHFREGPSEEKEAKTPRDKTPEEDGALMAVTSEPSNGSRFTITIRILGRIVSNPSSKCNIVEAKVLPR